MANINQEFAFIIEACKEDHELERCIFYNVQVGMIHSFDAKLEDTFIHFFMKLKEYIKDEPRKLGKVEFIEIPWDLRLLVGQVYNASKRIRQI